MALLTVEDVEAVSKTDFDDATATQCQFYIDVVTSYIENVTGVTFSKIVGDVVRYRADDYGQVVLDEWPVAEVTNIHERKRDFDYDDPEDMWDGEQTIVGLRPRRVVDVTMDYGLDPVPMDVVGVAVEAVRRAMATSPTGLKTRTVGDVTYEFAENTLTFPPGDEAVLDSYRPAFSTMRITTGVRGFVYPWAYGPVINGPTGWDCD